MIKSISLFFLFFISTLASGQTFIPLDNDTNEFIADVNFSLYKNKKVVYSGMTSPDKAVIINNATEYDSIYFTRPDYESLGLLKRNVDSIVLLSKKTVRLDEVVINLQKDKDIILGETNRFIKDQSRPFTRGIDHGTVFENTGGVNLQLDRIVFFVNKVNLKTAYRIIIYDVEETVPRLGNQSLVIGELLFSTDTLYLAPGQKDRIEADINSDLLLVPNKPVFVSFELIDYYDANNNPVTPGRDDLTKLKFQISDKIDFYSKGSDFVTHELTKNLLNVNLMINFDFANTFFKKPHKSILVTPAVLLYMRGVE